MSASKAKDVNKPLVPNSGEMSFTTLLCVATVEKIVFFLIASVIWTFGSTRLYTERVKEMSTEAYYFLVVAILFKVRK